MSLNGEANELRNMWTSASWPLKGWLVLSFFISISSLASLSETIIKWRSFFRDAVHFYQEWIGEPLKELFSIFYIDMAPAMINVFVIMCLMESVFGVCV